MSNSVLTEQDSHVQTIIDTFV